MPSLNVFSRAVSGRATQGEVDVLDGKQKAQQVYAKATPGRVMQDADVRAGATGAFDKVFGNAAYEDDYGTHAAASAAMEPASVRRNNLFNERKAHKADQAAPAIPAPATPPVEDRAGSTLMGFFRKTVSPNSTLRSDEPLGTLVQAFNGQDDSDAPGPSGLSDMHTAERVPVAWEVETKQLVAAGMRDEAMRRAAPSHGLIRCYVKRCKSLFGHTTYAMYLEAGDMFLLAARRRKKSKASTYVISQDPEDLKRDTENCVAKLKANFVGTEYMLWTKSDDADVRKGYGTESICVSFQNLVGKKSGPRVVHLAMPVPESGWQPSAVDGTDNLSNCLEMAKIKELPPYMERNLSTLSNKAAEYNDIAKGYTLDFGGRVKEASVKNLQLVSWNHNTDRQGADILLQFGKIDSTTYALDFAYPMSIETAFAVALASLDTKLCCAV